MIKDWRDEAVLVIGFNRPKHMRILIDRLRTVGVRRIYVAIDGPREDHPDDRRKVEESRKLVEDLDWDVRVEHLFHDRNLGCGLGVSTALTWFFEQVPRGIVLEDDIIPDPSFFPFCVELLDRYEDDDRVFAISGSNFVPRQGLTLPDDAYRFSQIPHIWGWATWRRSWEQHNLEIADWRSQLPLSALWKATHRSAAATAYWAGIFEVLRRGEVDTWDGQLVLASMVSGQLTATSNNNLVSNIGFDAEATHTFEDRKELQPIVPMPLPTSAVQVIVDKKADNWTRIHHFHATGLGMVHQFVRYLKRRQWR